MYTTRWNLFVKFSIPTTKNFFAKKASKFWTVTTSRLTENLGMDIKLDNKISRWNYFLMLFVFHLGCGQEAIWAGVSLGSLASWGHGPKPVTTVMEGLVMLWVLDVFIIPSGLQPNSIKVSGHSQLPVKGLKARPKQKGFMLVFQDFKMNWG